MPSRCVDIKALKAQVDIVSVVEQWVELRREGPRLKGLCPFHDDNKTLSLTVYPDKQSVFCFGCCWHGDVIAFVESVLHFSFREAVDWLCNHTGQFPMKERENRSSRLTAPIAPIPQLVINYWHSLVDDAVRNYYHSRLLTDEMIDFYKLGWTGTAYVIPWWEGKPGESDVWGVKFRRPEGRPKYYGMEGRSQSRLFNKWVLKDAKEATIFFGEFDALLAWQDGFNAVSPTSGQNKWLIGWNALFDNVNKIYIVPDVGETVAAYRIADTFGGKAKVKEYPPDVGTDYTEFRQNGYSAGDFRAMVLRDIPHKLQVKSYWEDCNVSSSVSVYPAWI